MAITPLGTLTGGAINPGLALAIPQLTLKLGELGAQIADLQANISVSAGIDVPDPTELLTAALSIVADLSATLSALPAAAIDVNLSANLDISVLIGLQLALQDLVATLQAGLSAGGIAAYAYAGEPRKMGQELGQVAQNGIAGAAPDGNVNGLILACGDPAAWASFGAIVKTS